MTATVKYRFRIQQPANIDTTVLVLTRYTENEDGDMALAEILTDDGWLAYRNWDALPSNLPMISGVDQLNIRAAEARIKEIEDRLYDAIMEREKQQHGTQAAPEPASREDRIQGLPVHWCKNVAPHEAHQFPYADDPTLPAWCKGINEEGSGPAE